MRAHLTKIAYTERNGYTLRENVTPDLLESHE